MMQHQNSSSLFHSGAQNETPNLFLCWLVRVPKVFYTAAARLPFPPASAGRFLKQRLMGEERRKAREEEEEEKAAAFPIQLCQMWHRSLLCPSHRRSQLHWAVLGMTKRPHQNRQWFVVKELP